MNRHLRTTAIALTLLAVPACSDAEPVAEAQDPGLEAGGQPSASGIEPARERPTIRTNYQGEFAPVPSDAGASYRVLANDRLPGGTREVVTRRDGREGTHYARWEFDCAGAAFRRLGEGPSVDRALDALPEAEAFAPLADAPIAADIARYACPA